MNNSEWLLNMTYEQREEWLEAEHADGDMDNDVSVQKRPDESCRQYAEQGKRQATPDCESDSREKLEDDVGFIVKEGFVTYKSIIGWLDRQAAITYSIDAWYIKRLEEERESLQDQVDDLQANLNRANDAFETARLELEEQIAELERECDDLHSRIEQWMNAAGNAHDMWEKADARRVEAERRVSALSEKLSRAYGNAHNTLRMMDEELA